MYMKNYTVKFLALSLLMPAMMRAEEGDVTLSQKYTALAVHAVTGAAAGLLQANIIGKFEAKAEPKVAPAVVVAAGAAAAAVAPAAPATPEKSMFDTAALAKYGQSMGLGIAGDEIARRLSELAIPQLAGQAKVKTVGGDLVRAAFQQAAFSYQSGAYTAAVNPFVVLSALRNLGSALNLNYAPVTDAVNALEAQAESALESLNSAVEADKSKKMKSMKK